MKKFTFFIAAILIAQVSMADVFSWGLKAGINSSKVKFEDFYDNNEVKFEPSSYEVGYHFGGFVRLKVAALYIQPELIYTHANAGIKLTDLGATDFDEARASYSNFDIPIMVGLKMGPARFNLGPVMTFNVSSDLNDVPNYVDDFTSSAKGASFGGQVGVGLDVLKKLTLDVKYEFGLSKLTDGVTIGGQEFKTDQRQSQFIASVGFMF